MTGDYNDKQIWTENDKTGHLHHFPLKWPKIESYIPIQKRIVILDFGCGNGLILKEIGNMNPEAELIGIDVSENALHSAARVLPRARFLKIEDGSLLPLESNSIDFIFCSEVIEHILDTENAFSEISRVLKPGGRILITTPHHGIIKNIIITLFAFDKHFNPAGPHIRFFSKKSVSRLLKKFGMKAVKWDAFGRFFTVPHSLIAVAEKK